MPSLRFLLLTSLVLPLAPVVLAQTVPTVTQALPPRSLAVPDGAAVIDLRSHFGLPGVTGQVIQLDTVLGRVNFELFDDTPLTKANFLAYVNAGRYNNTIIHRSDENFVIQGGGYVAQTTFAHIPTFGPVPNEFRHSNRRGTVAMAKLPDDPNSATSEWFINLSDNNAGPPASLDTQNGGFTVFARVIGNGMSVVDAIAALPRFNIASTNLTELPLRDVSAGQTTVEVRNLIAVNNATAVPIYPPAAVSVLAFTAQSSNPAVVSALINGSSLVLTPFAAGVATISVRATDTNGSTADATFMVNVTGGIAILTSPQSQHVAPGAGVTLAVEAQALGGLAYQWNKDGTPIPGATGPAHVIAAASAGDMGFYSVTLSSGGGSLTSPAAIITVDIPGRSRLVNVSTRGTLSSGGTLTPGFVMRGTGTKKLVIRAVGPSLAQFGVIDPLPNPKMEVIPLTQSNVVLANDDWNVASPGAVADLIATSAAVSAFQLPPEGSKDAGAVANLPVPPTGGYTVSIAAASGAATGEALAEIYDADALDAPVRLINVSTLGPVAAGGLTPGFVIGGTAPKQLLVRAVGPRLADAPFNVPGALEDPQLAIYPLGKDFIIASNNDWGDGNPGAELAEIFSSAGAFPLEAGSRDAAVLVRLPPGAYTTVATGVGGTTGTAIVEVYDLDP